MGLTDHVALLSLLFDLVQALVEEGAQVKDVVALINIINIHPCTHEEKPG